VSVLRNLIVAALSKKNSNPKMVSPEDFLITADMRYDHMFPNEAEWGVDVDGRRIRVKKAQDPDDMLSQWKALLPEGWELPKKDNEVK
jgi:hypothetical protein